jgi:hypothetical protein
MAAGDPYIGSIADRYFKNFLENDGLLAIYAPGGAWPERPPDDWVRPCVRWWERIAGRTDFVQDGFLSRAQSNPEYVVAILDVQSPEKVDRIYGTEGAKLDPQQPYMELGALRIYSLLHNRQASFDGYSIYTTVVSDGVHGAGPITNADSNSLGNYEVYTGFIVQLRIT